MEDIDRNARAWHVYETACSEFMSAHANELLIALSDQRRLRDATTGECVEVGELQGQQDIDGNQFVGVLIESKPDELRRGGPIIYRKVALVPLDQEGE
jgi:hypothetical protein